MTVNELKDYFTMLADHGKGDAQVVVVNKKWNPATEIDEIANAVLMEWKIGDSIVVLQTD
jgi:hypothetical protein